MTPPDTAAPIRAGRGTTHRRAPSRPPRRVSGPTRHPRSAGAHAPLPLPAGPRLGAGTGARPPLARRLARAGARIGDARLLDRLVRGRGWIGLVAVGLMGIVFMQVSMLRLNAGISRAVTSAETLERQNSMLRGDISTLDASERIQGGAGAFGMIQPPAGQVNYLDARKADAVAAARAIRPPNPVKPIDLAATAAPAAQGAPVQTTTAPAQTTTAPAQTTTAAPPTQSTTTAGTTAAAAQTTTQATAAAQTATAPAQTTTQATAAAQTATAPSQTTPAVASTTQGAQ